MCSAAISGDASAPTSSEAPPTDSSYGVFDIPYVGSFQPYLAPAWLDHVALLASVAPPDRTQGFSWCDLGCGSGVTATILAATHPTGRFVGVDINAEHIARARRFAADAEVPNVEFHTTDFAATALQNIQFDYVVTHGVYSWVGSQTRELLHSFIDRHLKPGGIVYLSYNAMPGWLPELPFQRLLRAFAGTLPGNSEQRFTGALAAVRDLAAAGVPALKGSRMLAEISEHPDRYPASYLAHEYLGASWQPLWVSEVRQTMTSIGLSPVGSATLRDNYDAWVLGRRAREALDPIENDDLRELTRDYFTNQSFRRDVFVRDGQRITDQQRQASLFNSCFAFCQPADRVEYFMETPAGRVDFDNPAARAIVTTLASGPTTLAEIGVRSPAAAQDILANGLVLAASGALRPVEATSHPVASVNQAIHGRHAGADALTYLVLSCGTALRVDAELLRELGTTGTLGRERFPGWSALLAAYCR